jgi:type II secretion system protein D
MICAGLAYAAVIWIPKLRPAGDAASDSPGVSSSAEESTDATDVEAPEGSPGTNEAAAAESAPAEGEEKPADDAESASGEEEKEPEEIQLSFKGAEINVIVQWLAKTTGKSIVKHPQVQCKLTIVSSESLSVRDALTLVYQALSLEGFSAVETRNSVIIVPEGKEPKISPELIDSADGEIPEGRQILVRVFELEHLQPGDLKAKVQGLLSETAKIETDARARQLIVTDYTDNIRLLDDLIKRLDVGSVSDTVVEIVTLKHAEAESIGILLTTVINAQFSRPEAGGASASPSPPDGSGGPPPGPGGGSAAPDQGVKIWPDKTSNRLIIVAPGSKISEIRKLLDVLDVAKPQDVAVRVLPLNHVGASELVQEIGPLYQSMSGKSLKDMIEISANERSNSLIVLSSESNFESIQSLVALLDNEDAQERLMRAFQLEHADAEDVAEQLQELSQGRRVQARYYFYNSRGDSGGDKLRVVADRRRNTVIVQASPGMMEGVEEMVEILDKPVAVDTLAPRIYPLKFVSAVDIEEVLNELFLKKQQQRSYWDYYSGSSDSSDREVGKLYGKVRITSEPYSNSIIVSSDSAEYLTAVEKILMQLDAPSDAGESTLRVPLVFADAVTVATSVNVLFAKRGSPPVRESPQQNQQREQRNPQAQGGPTEEVFSLVKEATEQAYYPWLGPQQENARGNLQSNINRVSDLIGRVRIVPDRRSNALLVTSNVHFFPQILKLINDMDAPSPQVLIEAKILEVSSDFRDKLGVRWSPDGEAIFSEDDLDNSLLVGTGGLFSNVVFGSSMAESLRIGVLDASIDLDFLVQFLRRNTGTRILAEPQVNIADNEIGKLFVGSQVPFINLSTLTAQGGRNDSFTYKDVGIILEVTPQISNESDVALKIHVESSNIRSGETLFGGAIIDTRDFHSDLLASSGQTLVLGGIIQSESAEITRKVPFLGSIPVIGWAFKKKDSVVRDVELMVFLRPTITRSPQEAAELMLEIEDRIPKIRAWKEEIEAAKQEAYDQEVDVNAPADLND